MATTPISRSNLSALAAALAGEAMLAAEEVPSLPSRGCATAAEAAAALPLRGEAGRKRERAKRKKKKLRNSLDGNHNFQSIAAFPALPSPFSSSTRHPRKKNLATMQSAAEKISRIFKKKDGHDHEHDTSSEHSEHSVHEEGVEAEAAAAVDR